MKLRGIGGSQCAGERVHGGHVPGKGWTHMDEALTRKITWAPYILAPQPLTPSLAFCTACRGILQDQIAPCVIVTPFSMPWFILHVADTSYKYIQLSRMSFRHYSCTILAYPVGLKTFASCSVLQLGGGTDIMPSLDAQRRSTSCRMAKCPTACTEPS